ncbi:Putative phage repressor protein [Sodalis praecaptivus]|uniref:Putative phage repressor protein n=1 Tax=Sodalis praecaptivus TaxID=1239307 RepID=W0HUG9_9GAMM|nr:helix-turn-helix transcriptional regulator [Sodalis praecaptivus]AHF75798.1 Putative phage repressor protein [Sodalis praecaptivus]
MQQNNHSLSEPISVPLKKIGKNLVYLMKKREIDAQHLSALTGIGIATINNLRRGVGNPTITTLSAISDFFGVKMGNLTDMILEDDKNQLGNVKNIPLIKYNDLGNYYHGKIDITKSYTVEVEDFSDDSLIAIEIANNALSPFFESGTICVVSEQERFNDGDVVLVKIKDYPLCFRRVFVGDDVLYFSKTAIESDGDTIELKSYTLIGVLIKTIRKLK